MSPRRLLHAVLATQDEVDEASRQRGIDALMVHGVGVTAMVALQGGPFLPAFLLALGGTNAQVGLLTTFAFASQFMSVPGLGLVQRYPRRRALTIACAMGYRLCWLAICAIPLLGLESPAAAVLAVLLLAEILSSLSGPAWNSFLRDVVPGEVRGSVMARRMAMGAAASLGATLVGGWFLEASRPYFPDQPWAGYSILFLIGVITGVAGVAMLVRVPEPTHVPEPGRRITELLRTPFGDRNFRNLLWFNAAWSLSVSLAGPFFVVYMLRRLEVPLTLITGLVVCSQLASMTFVRLWGRLSDRLSNKSVLALSCPLFLLSVATWPLTTLPEKHALSIPLLFGIYLLSGMSNAGVGMAGSNIALELAPEGDAASYLTVHGLAGALTGTVGPVLGGLLADKASAAEIAVVVRFGAGDGTHLAEALSLRGLDFVFLAAVVLGFYALHRLSFVEEEGEVTEDELRAHFLAEVTAALRGFTPIPGLRALVNAPASAIYRIRGATVRNPAPAEEDPEPRGPEDAAEEA